MYCKHCGSEVPDDALFCSHCGTKLAGEMPKAAGSPAMNSTAPETTVPPEAPAPAAARTAKEGAKGIPNAGNSASKLTAKPSAPQAAASAEKPRKPFLEEMRWNVSEYPDSNVIEKTEEINFDWNADPDKVPDSVPRRAQVRPQPRTPQEPKKSSESVRVAEIFDRVVPAGEVKAAASEVKKAASGPKPAAVQQSAAPAKDAQEPGLGKFNTVNRRNEEFQRLLKKEHEKINVAGTIGSEQNEADTIARQRFDTRQEEMTMEQFLEKEGTVKLYEPKPLESNVLAKIEAQEKQRARQRAEEAARLKAEEEARAAAAAKKRAEAARLNSEEEASAAAAEEIRLAEEARIRQRTEEEARRKAAAQAAHLEAIAQRKAQQEQAALQEQERRAAEEARARAEAERRAREEAAAKARKEAEAARAAEEAARLKAEAELNAAREAARIRAQQEASLAAREEARFQEEQQRRQYEEEVLRQKQALRARQQNKQGGEAVVEAQVKDALAQTARMREEEEAKIKAALAGIRNGRFSGTIAAGSDQPAEEPAAVKPAEIPRHTAAVSVAEAMGAGAQAPAAPEAPAFDAPAEPAAPAFDTQAFDAPAEPAAPAFDTQAFDAPAEPAAPVFDAPAFDAPTEPAAPVFDTQAFDAPAEPAAPVFDVPAFDAPVAPETPAAAAPEAVSTAPEQIEEAHRMTQSQIDDMAKARENFFADFPDADEAEKIETTPSDLSRTRMVNKDDLMANINTTKKISKDVIEEAAPEAAAVTEAEEVFRRHTGKMQEQMDEMDDLLNQFNKVREGDTSAETPAVQQVTELPTAAETEGASDAVDHMFTGFQMDAAVIREAAAKLEQNGEHAPDMAEAVSQISDLPVDAPAAGDLTGAEIPAAAGDAAEALAKSPATPLGAAGIAAGLAGAAAAGEKPGLEDTMVMPIQKEEIAAAVSAGEPELSAKEQKRLAKEKAKEAKRKAKEEKKRGGAVAVNEAYTPDDVEEEPKAKGGVGRTILMIILIILCIVFALELAGIGIKLLAPTSGAAEFIDNILNNLIHMITG